MTETHRLGGVTLSRLAVSDMDNNVYVLTAPSGEQLLVDAADDAPAVLELVRGAGAGPLRSVLTTHRHWDHHRALVAVVGATGAQVLAGADDADHLPLPPDRRLQHGDTVAVDAAGTVVLDVVALRGHTPGSVALALTEPDDADRPGRVHLLTGDSLFPGGVGRTTTPAEFASLIDDVEARIFAVYPDDTVVWPGHGAPTTLGVERPHLAEWRARGW